MGDVAHIRVGAPLPPQFPVTLEQLGVWLAEAEVMGGYRALADHDPIDKIVWWTEARETAKARAHFWQARIRGELEKRE